MSKVFISYRRSEAESEVGRLFDYLEREIGARKVFKDVDSIAPGEDFRKVIDGYVKSSDIFLLIIGDRWPEIQDDQGRRRIEQPDDFVRTEILTALSHGVRIIPVLIRGARMPSPAELPPDIAQLAYRNALHLRPDPDFRRDCSRLLAEITRGRVRLRRTRMVIGAVTAIVVVVAITAIYVSQQTGFRIVELTEQFVRQPTLQRAELSEPHTTVEAARPSVETASALAEVVAVGKEMLSNLDQTRNTGSGWDYWPDGGIRIAYDHLATFADYETLAKLSPYPIFVSGPHGTGNLNLNERFAFGHYNPQFLRWFHDHLLEILKDRAFVETTTPLFENYLGKTAMAYWATYTVLNEHPNELELLLEDYKTRIDNRTLPPRYYYNLAWGEAEAQFTSLKKLNASYDSNVVAPAIYFWLRRHIDGTHQQVFSMLESLLLAYGMIEDRLYFNPEELPRPR
jgi:hypothetical protein